MRLRQTTLEIFATFLRFEDDAVSGWVVDGRLRRSIQGCLERAGTDPSPGFWALYWHRIWQAESSSIASNHLAAYLQEVCYWAAQKLVVNVSGGQSIADFFQIAIIKLDRVLKGFDPHHGNDLKSYASFAFTNAIKDTLRQRQEVDVCTDWALLHKVSHKRLVESLHNLGFNPETIAVYILAWQCFKTIYAPTDKQRMRKLEQPNLVVFTAIASLYDRDRVSAINGTTPQSNPELMAQWLTTCGRAVRSYLYPTLISASGPEPQTDSGEFLDSFESTFQSSLLTQAIDRETDTDRQVWQSQLQKVLLKATIKVDIQSQRILQLYYGERFTQQEIAQQLATKQYTISRRLNSARQSLLTALGEWSQATLHKSLDTNVINDLSITIEEWLKVHYSPPDLPVEF